MSEEEKAWGTPSAEFYEILDRQQYRQNSRHSKDKNNSSASSTSRQRDQAQRFEVRPKIVNSQVRSQHVHADVGRPENNNKGKASASSSAEVLGNINTRGSQPFINGRRLNENGGDRGSHHHHHQSFRDAGNNNAWATSNKHSQRPSSGMYRNNGTHIHFESDDDASSPRPPPAARAAESHNMRGWELPESTRPKDSNRDRGLYHTNFSRPLGNYNNRGGGLGTNNAHFAKAPGNYNTYRDGKRYHSSNNNLGDPQLQSKPDAEAFPAHGKGKPISIPTSEREVLRPPEPAKPVIPVTRPMELHAPNSPYWKLSREDKTKRFLAEEAHREASGDSLPNREDDITVLKHLMESMSLERKLPEVSDQPKELTVTLFQHQLEGVAWLKKQEASMKSAILADDMGLGKTIQSIALILATKPVEGPKTTLIITNLSLLSQWEKEVAAKTRMDALSTAIFHGPSRIRNASKLLEYDVVITTYSTVASEFRAESLPSGPLYDCEFLRIILDEAQMIKNHKSKTANACFSLKAKYRICLTGTPIQNNIDELFSLFHFLKVKPIDDLKVFKKTFSKKVSGSDESLERIRAIFKAILLRRTKDSQKIDLNQFRLPNKNITHLSLTFSEEERKLYNEINDSAQSQYSKLLKQEVKLLAEDDSDLNQDINDLIASVATLNIEARESLGATSDIDKLRKSWVSSSKVDKVIELLKEGEAKAPKEKWIIFSQFTRMIDILEIAFEREDIPFIRYDGSMSSKTRSRNLQDFCSDDGPRVCVISLQCGAFGLNLTAANHVILFDIWWNPMVESQAIDRVHRIGQTRDVEVIRLTIKETVEDQILSLQQQKTQLISGALNEAPLQSKFT
ncbi:hypothetical protein HDU67_003399 [Dinochytrium kinnereticum]|nr:hypothetical protein HDU67_003399 [Dinochytrium kinnereticum]